MYKRQVYASSLASNGNPSYVPVSKGGVAVQAFAEGWADAIQCGPDCFVRKDAASVSIGDVLASATASTYGALCSSTLRNFLCSSLYVVRSTCFHKCVNTFTTLEPVHEWPCCGALLFTRSGVGEGAAACASAFGHAMQQRLTAPGGCRCRHHVDDASLPGNHRGAASGGHRRGMRALTRARHRQRRLLPRRSQR